MEDTATTLETALQIVASRAPSHDTPNGGKIVIVPEGYRAERISPLEEPLPRIRQAVTMHDRDSFTSYVNRYKNDGTRIFAEPGFLASGVARIAATMDYHTPDKADYGAHVATYSPRYSDQWQRWQKASSVPMKQAEFAEFVEEVRADIVEPDAARLMDIVRTFKASKKVEYDSLVYQSNGDVMLAYDERTEQKGQSGALPETMKIGIPVYFRGTTYAVPIFIRFKVSSGAVQFHLKIDRADVIEDAAFQELTAEVNKATGIDVYLGRR